MAITYLGTRQVITGLSTDTKPINVGEGALFLEYDTGRQYMAGNNGNTWTEVKELVSGLVSISSPTIEEEIPEQTILLRAAVLGLSVLTGKDLLAEIS